MDWSLWSTFSSFVFHTFTTQVTTDNVVMRVTRPSIIDWVYSKTQTLLTTLRIRNYLRVELVYLSHSNIRHHELDVLTSMGKIYTWGCQRATPHRTQQTTPQTTHALSHTQHHTQHHTETEKETQEKEKKTKKRREAKENREEILLLKNVPNQQNPQDELAHNVSKKKTFGRIIRSEVQNLTHVFNYLHDLNSNFRPAGIYSEWVRDRIVWLFPGESRLFGCCEQVCTCRWVLLDATRCGAEKKEMNMLVRQVPKQIVGESGGEARS